MVVNIRIIAKMLSPAITGFGVIALIPAIYALISGTPGAFSFVSVTVLAVAIGNILRIIGKNSPNFIALRELFLFTFLLWSILAFIASFPFFIQLDDIDFLAALFESVSSLSTTGATVINNLDARPPSILLWRSILQYLGGIGFVVIGIAVLPTLALGGMNLFKTESIDGRTKLTPHIKTMAFALLMFYIVLLVLCTGCYIFFGLDIFLAINAAMCTVATGGMMPIDASMNGLPAGVHYSAIFFMFICSCPFLIILASFTESRSVFFKDEQVKGLFLIILIFSAAVILSLIFYNGYDVERAIRVGLFNVSSIISSSGFTLEDFSQWNPFASVIFLSIFAIGGCSGSTSGGIKIFRIQVCYRMLKCNMLRSLHPHGVIYPRFNGTEINSMTSFSVVSFLVAYILVTFCSTLAATLMGLPITDAFTATLTCLSNIGPTMGDVVLPNSANFASLSGPLHLLFSIDMLLGRLEIIPVLLCFTRFFWRK